MKKFRKDAYMATSYNPRRTEKDIDAVMGSIIFIRNKGK